jgi:serine protease AprX
MEPYLKKIDPYLYYFVNTCSEECEISCIIYAKNTRAVRAFFQNSPYCKKFQEYPFIDAFGLTVLKNKLNTIAQNENIQYITASTKVFAQINIAKKVTKIEKLNKQGILGRGVTIAIIDTGILPHLDFVTPNNRIICFKDFLSKKQKPYDDNGHGTFVAGIAAGSGLISSQKFAGVAPKANIISLKTLNHNGETSAFGILEAMQWVYDNHAKYNIKVVCMSFGSNPLSGKDPLSAGAEALWHKGITVVAAAGNSGPETKSIKSPGISSRIITVGALDDKRQENGVFLKEQFEVADFSSRGPAFRFFKPDLLAPGVNLISTSNKTSEFYTKLSGTSVATPIIAGLSCLLIEKYPHITPDQIKGLLITHATPIMNDKNAEGYGLIDATDLVEN